MKGVDIFLHAVRMVLGNLSVAIRISAVLMVVQLLAVLLLGAGSLFSGEDTTARIEQGTYPLGGAFLGLVVMIVTGLWVAVSWHRFILREEVPAGPLPAFNAGAIGSYFLAGIILGIILVLISVPVAFLAGIILAPFLIAGGGEPGILAGFVLFVVVYLPVAYVAYRLSPVLPSAALQARMPLKEAWYATGTSGADFVVLTVVTVVAAWLIQLPAALLAPSAPLLAAILGFLANWASVLVGASILTTIYGHYVEKRALAGA